MSGVTTGAAATNTAVDELQKQVNAASSAIGLDKVLNQAGDVKGFIQLVALFAVGIVVVGFVGATVINITRMTPAEIDDLFPTNLQDFPYEVPIGKKNPSGNSIADLYSQFHADQDTEKLTRATLEFVYPMKRQSFPYTSWFLSEEFKGNKGHTIAQWYASTCAGTFCAWRSFYKVLIVLGKWIMNVAETVADFALFYIFPYICLYLILLPVIPAIGFVLSIFTSTMYNIPGGWIFTFAPIMGILLAIANIFTTGFLVVGGWALSFIIFISGFGMGMVNLAWWAIIGIMLWLYTCMFLVLSPLLHEGGIKNVMNEFVKKRKSLMIIFIILVLMAAFMKLNAILSFGFLVGGAICAFLIFRMKGAEGPAVPGAGLPKPAAPVAAAAAPLK
jgi:hypothetical protein